MGVCARLMYRLLVWKERQLARRAGAVGSAERYEPGNRDFGARSELLAYWYLRQTGYTVVARNWRSRSGAGELDLIAWEGGVLTFVEVKARSSEVSGPPELAVSSEKQTRIIKTACEYMRQFKGKPVNYRFDIVSVFVNSAKDLEIRLIKDAFRGRGPGPVHH